MSYQALYRKYRPSNFDEVVGQEHIIQTLKNAIYQNKIAHAYLFCGPRGTGKTSIAKIFAKMLNCEDEQNKPCGTCMNCQMVKNGNHPDIIEIDAASNNGVDEVRNLIDKVKYAPLQGKYKVYIIDEVHMMSTGAFNALLKTIEEPPEHVIFIFATTEPNKVIPTIISRCQRYDFSKVSRKDIEKRLTIVCKEENIEVEKEAIALIAQLADGGMRDSLSILDQCVAYCIDNIKLEDVRKIYGVLNTEDIANIYSLLYKKEVNELLRQLEEFADAGVDLQKFVRDFIKIMKNSIILEYSENTTLVSENDKNIITKYISNSPTQFKLTLLENLIETYSKFSYSSNILDYIETCLLKVLYMSGNTKISENQISKNKQREEYKSNEELVKKQEEPISEIKKNSEIIKNSSVEEEKTSEYVSDVSRETLKQEKISNSKIILNDEFVLQLLVSANKQDRKEDTDKIRNVSFYLSDLNYAKYANTLRNVNIVASGINFIVVCTPSEMESKNINELEHQSGYEEFLGKLLGKEKKIFAIDKNHMNRILEEFKTRMRNNDLPEPITINLTRKSESYITETTENLLKDVFPTLTIVDD